MHNINHLKLVAGTAGLNQRDTRIQHRGSSIEDQASRIEHRGSSIEYQASSIENPASSIEDPASNMQNKPNFRKSQMNVSDYITKAYDKRTLGQRGKSKPNSNPNKPNSKISKSALTLAMTKPYNKIPPILSQKNKPNPNPKRTQTNPISTRHERISPSDLITQNSKLLSGKTLALPAGFGYPKHPVKTTQLTPNLLNQGAPA